ncbi:MAG: toxin TcdB middle/N-terminal domain-containing protein, partial [Thermodesulfobacteriota bacterium]
MLIDFPSGKLKIVPSYVKTRVSIIAFLGSKTTILAQKIYIAGTLILKYLPVNLVRPGSELSEWEHITSQDIINNSWFGTNDINGDGKDDLWYRYENNIGIVLSKRNPNDFIKSINTHYGGKIEYSYKSSAEIGKVHRCPFVLQNVNTITYRGGVNEPAQPLTFDYNESYYNISEREFEGYKKVIQTNPDNTILEREFIQTSINENTGEIENEFTKGKLYKEILSKGGTKLKEVIYCWDPDKINAFSSHVKLEQKNVTYDGGAWEKETYFYYPDKAGLLELKTTDGNAGDGSPGPTIYTKFDYDNKDSANDQGQRWRKKLEEISDASSNLIRKTEYTYDDNGNLLHTYYRHLINPIKDVDEERSYYPSGNLNWVKDGNGNPTTYSYDNNDVFVSRIDYPSTTNIGGGTTPHSVTFPAYDYRFGKVKEQIDENPRWPLENPPPVAGSKSPGDRFSKSNLITEKRQPFFLFSSLTI